MVASMSTSRSTSKANRGCTFRLRPEAAFYLSLALLPDCRVEPPFRPVSHDRHHCRRTNIALCGRCCFEQVSRHLNDNRYRKREGGVATTFEIVIALIRRLLLLFRVVKQPTSITVAFAESRRNLSRSRRAARSDSLRSSRHTYRGARTE